MRNILQKDFASVNAVHSGEWLNRLTNDTVVVADSYVEILPGLVGMVVKLISQVYMDSEDFGIRAMEQSECRMVRSMTCHYIVMMKYI